MPDEKLITLYRIVDHVSRGDTVGETLARIVEFAAAFLNCDECCTYVRHGDELLPWVWKPEEQGSLKPTRLPVDSGFAAEAGEQRAPVAVSVDAEQGAAFKPFEEWSTDPGETFVCAPFISRSRLLGVITLRHRRPRSYSRDEFRFLACIGYVVGADLGIHRVEKENSDLLLELETRKLVERSKGILQRELGISDREAFRALQRHSQQEKRPMKEIAQAIILCSQLGKSAGWISEGAVAKWQGQGLQNPYRRLDSVPRLDASDGEILRTQQH